ncbi:MAG TPA: pentapeptide repeat-containing protein, partial [Ktedonobacterales bacterium]
NLHLAHLTGANLHLAHLEGANLTGAHLEGTTYPPDDADILRVRRWADDFPATLLPADLHGAFFDPATDFTGVTWTNPTAPRASGPWLADVRWGGANLTVVEWEDIAQLQDEFEANRSRTMDRGKEKPKGPATRTADYQAAGRAYRLLFVALRNQGLTAPATRYHFRAEIMDRKALWHRRRYARWLFSWLLGMFAGYGDYIGRLFITYGAVIVAFALLMFAFSARLPSPDSIGDVLILSVTSFHGRGVQPPGLHLNDALAALSGVEAIFGLLVEGLFIAAFTRRVTGG